MKYALAFLFLFLTSLPHTGFAQTIEEKGVANSAFFISLHHRVIPRRLEGIRAQTGCVQLNREIPRRSLTGSLPICFGPEMRGDKVNAFSLSVGASARRALVETGDNWWARGEYGFTGGFSFLSEMSLGFKFTGDGNGSAGVANSATASINTDEESVTIDNSSDFVTGNGNFNGDAKGNSTFRFGFGVHFGLYTQLGPFILEGGVRYDYIHRLYPTGYFSIGARLPRLRD